MNPAAQHDFAIRHIQGHRNLIGRIALDGGTQDLWGDHCSSAQDNPVYTQLKSPVNVGQGAQAAAQLDCGMWLERFQAMHDLPERCPVLVVWLFKSAIQVDDVQPTGSGIQPAARHRCRIVAEDRLALRIALHQPDDLPVAQVDCGVYGKCCS